MAVSPTYQSSQTAFSTSSPLTITKPTSLAVGDLMVAHISMLSESGTASLSGWTQVISTADPNTGTSGLTSVILYKVATSGDVAASDFAFTVGQVPAQGAISRFTDVHATSPVDQSHGTAGASLGDSGITPTLANSLLLIFASTKDADGAFAATSSYAVTTSNPGTWTEAYDRGDNNGGVGYSIAMAYGARSPLTATGNVTLSVNDTLDKGVTQIVNIPYTGISPISGAFTLPTHLATIVSPTLTGSYTILAPTLPDLGGDWTTSSKSSTTWTNSSIS